MGVFADIVIGNRRGVAEKWPNTLSDGTLPKPRLWLPDEDKMYGRKQNERGGNFLKRCKGKRPTSVD